MATSLEYKGYVVSAEAEEWADEVWAGSYVVTVQNTGKMIREMPDAVIGQTFASACDNALDRGRRYIDRVIFKEAND
ncbi:hypothetical protein [Noviherbaspirillum pedocola]|uniref:Uncharacterized protein n=1 Tax=Noviherbaspirillum pedocola TaxID=2801341 RepID=A0A934SU00_9BURK|nr:hypothetical protein [Noviherbaspirillum pedocola]MBK4735514.1 hypothetical protein [Noviherbaspirillum pedocola]